jgi:TetR/AcrR family transcriptional regulator, fatty acid biosynthesis regulator
MPNTATTATTARVKPKAPKTAQLAAVPELTMERGRRMAPEVRAGLILDCAAKLVVNEGLTEITMERIGRDANVSKALIYNYFPNLNELLRALLEREINEFRVQAQAEIKAARDFKDLVRRTTRAYIEHTHRRGPLLQYLRKESSIARSMLENKRNGHEQTLRYFAKRLSDEYELPFEVAVATVEMQMAMTEAAAQRVSNARDTVESATDVCVQLLIGGIEALVKATRAQAKKSQGKQAKEAAVK